MIAEERSGDMTTSQKLKYCVGCRDNFYNMRSEDQGKCWMLGEMKLVKRKQVPIDRCPPWDMPAFKVPSCYRKSGYVFVDADRTF